MNPYTVDELKQMLIDSVYGHFQTVDLSKIDIYAKEFILDDDTARQAAISDSRLAVSLIMAVSEVIEKNNQRLLEVIARG